MFELTFLVAGRRARPWLVALILRGLRRRRPAGQSIDAMAVVYMALTLVWLVVALRFVNPTQIVARAKQPAAH